MPAGKGLDSDIDLFVFIERVYHQDMPGSAAALVKINQNRSLGKTWGCGYRQINFPGNDSPRPEFFSR
jgi:hypothetical protein